MENHRKMVIYIENHHVLWVNQLEMAIFNSYFDITRQYMDTFLKDLPAQARKTLNHPRNIWEIPQQWICRNNSSPPAHPLLISWQRGRWKLVRNFMSLRMIQICRPTSAGKILLNRVPVTITTWQFRPSFSIRWIATHWKTQCFSEMDVPYISIYYPYIT